MRTAARQATFALGATLGALVGGPAAAHPHIWVEARIELAFDTSGRAAAVRHVWRFDPEYSAYALEGIDTDGDGRFSDEELRPLVELNIDSLADYDYFASLSLGDTALPLARPDEYWLDYDGRQLTLFMSQPLAAPVAPSAPLRLTVFDPEYFVAFSFPDDPPGGIPDAPPSCTIAYTPPQELDAAMMARLAAIPADERGLPPALASAAAGLAGYFTVECAAP